MEEGRSGEGGGGREGGRERVRTSENQMHLRVSKSHCIACQ